MANSNIWKRLKYRNCAFALAGLLLIVLGIASACEKMEAQKILNTKSTSENTTDTQDSIQKRSFITVEQNNSTNLGLGTLALVNSKHKFMAGQPNDCVSSYGYIFNEDGDKIFSIKSLDVSLKPFALKSFSEMCNDYYKKSKSCAVMMTSGFRTEKQQQELYENAKTELKNTSDGDQVEIGVEKGGYSEFQTGLSCYLLAYEDGLTVSLDEVDTYDWLINNCHLYGFVQRYPENKADYTRKSATKSILRYVGLPHSGIMQKENICLEEYTDFIKKYSFEKPYEYFSHSGAKYLVYYTPKSQTDITKIKVMTDYNGNPYPYCISGNNVDGYVTAVNTSGSDSLFIKNDEFITTTSDDDKLLTDIE